MAVLLNIVNFWIVSAAPFGFLFRPLLRRELYILKWVFFVQTIMADRYIHRTELRLVSLESLSKVEHGIFFFSIFV